VPFNERHLMFMDASLSGRLESGDIADGLARAAARYYWRWHRRGAFFALVSGEASEALDPEEQIQLGGDSGLRGYPLRYQTGTSRALLTLEQRLYTEWFPWRLFYVGGAVFFDVGRTWGRGAVGEESRGWLKDVGIGLRLGNARGAFGSVLHFDVAFPLDRTPDIESVQFLVETKQSF
jgi:hemolysin activation/secretion protein